MLPTADYDHAQAVRQILDEFSRLKFSIPNGQWTIIASFFLYATGGLLIKPIAIGAGTKCLPASRLPYQGEALHDSHAEVLARRAAIRWLIEEISRAADGTYDSPWLIKTEEGMYALRNGVQLGLYVSTLPSLQDEQTAALKDSTIRSDPIDPSKASRGRDNYSLYGVLRTKPGRADSPSSSSMSCSDKIAAWTVLGIQGAIASQLLSPVYISAIVIGDVTPELVRIVRKDCERAFSNRLQGIVGKEHRGGFLSVS
ncbi:hypothetical protein AAF712_003688 [Marasmius tenuissimus]|uniref:A to I editase domain-containing protein n=1 Tax=Marasmius tenuissimus TaxID=585030 RepID=A0ABR3A6W1_9AGAR